MPDILGILHPSGRLLCIEVKKPGGVVSVEQKEFLDIINRNGGLGFVAQSINDVEEFLIL